jgi:hypothetical protein
LASEFRISLRGKKVPSHVDKEVTSTTSLTAQSETKIFKKLKMIEKLQKYQMH